jgi:hypothetical protein
MARCWEVRKSFTLIPEKSGKASRVKASRRGQWRYSRASLASQVGVSRRELNEVVIPDLAMRVARALPDDILEFARDYLWEASEIFSNIATGTTPIAIDLARKEIRAALAEVDQEVKERRGKLLAAERNGSPLGDNPVALLPAGGEVLIPAPPTSAGGQQLTIECRKGTLVPFLHFDGTGSDPFGLPFQSPSPEPTRLESLVRFYDVLPAKRLRAHERITASYANAAQRKPAGAVIL